MLRRCLLLVVLCLGLTVAARANTTLTPSDSTAMDWSCGLSGSKNSMTAAKLQSSFR